MPGQIIGCFGFQRSGKTLMAVNLASYYKSRGCPIYTNMDIEGTTKIESLDDIPLDFKPKTLLLDEVYYFLDSRNWKNNTDSSIFFNTIGKQNINLVLTAINPDTIEKRLRDQLNYVIFAKSTNNNIHYKFIDTQRKNFKEITLKKCPELFQKAPYNTLQIPDLIDINLKNFTQKVKLAQEKQTK